MTTPQTHRRYLHDCGGPVGLRLLAQRPLDENGPRIAAEIRAAFSAEQAAVKAEA